MDDSYGTTGVEVIRVMLPEVIGLAKRVGELENELHYRELDAKEKELIAQGKATAHQILKENKKGKGKKTDG